MNAVLYKLSLIGVKDTTILQERLPTLNRRLQNMDLPAFDRATLAAGRNTIRGVKITREGFSPRPSLKSSAWSLPYVKMKVFVVLSESHDWLAWIC